MTWRARSLVASAGAVAIGAAGISTAFAGERVETINPDLTAVTVFNINDFHGRIDTNGSGALGKDFACTVVTNQKAVGAGNYTFLSAGDNIGATPFTSFSQQDEPTIEFLSALGLEATAVGNHEFDTGWADLNDRIMPMAGYEHLGANVYRAGSSTPALPEYSIATVNGLRVGIIGAVTQETASLVDPGGISAITFGDPVEAVNRVAGEIDGDVDIIIAQYHEGATSGDSTLEAEVGRGGAFADIVNGTSPLVDAIFTAHTHQTYAWNAPIPGGEGTRPVVQSNSYAELLGQVTLGVDPETMTVEEFTVANTSRTGVTADCEADATYQAAAAIVDRAVAAAAEIGDVVIGSITGDITTAHQVDENGEPVLNDAGAPVRDDRLRESTLGNEVAQAWLWAMNAEGRPGADIGIMNPGGLRADLWYGDNGEITFAEAAAINPFANTMMTADVTGAQFKTLLEQQWQPEGSSRPFLKLGLSDNVRYTYNPDAPRNERITGIWFNGEPMDPAATYTVASGSFLLNGGDNFTVLAEGTNHADSGLVDLEAWVSYFEANSPVAPNYEKNGVAVHSDLPISGTQGESVTFTVSGVDLTSIGAPDNTEFTIWLDDVEVGTATIEPAHTADEGIFPTRDGLSEVTFTVPADAPVGAAVITLVAEPSGTIVKIAAEVLEGKAQPTQQPTAPGPIVETDVTGTNGFGNAGIVLGLLLALALAAVVATGRRRSAQH
ncbi:MAG: bifunctional UDP-sugar hydrolase/5'-nucleotidase [Actinomycetia bacterium]|nr:bifunctional UDP-sugar hydrolase/5'-nucleotidase [Actinomycetes bacterium]